MARTDDYDQAFQLASQQLRQANLHRLAKLAGASSIEATSDGMELSLPFLGRPHLVRVNERVEILREETGEEATILERILVAHYLLGGDGEPPSGRLITFREIPDGHFYDDAFQRRARQPFLSVFGREPERFRTCAARMGGQPAALGDAAMRFQVFPRFSLHLVLWEGDDEFPPEATILFDDNIHHYLAAEDIAVLSGMVVYPLLGMARGKTA